MIFSGRLPTYWWLIISAACVTRSRADLQVEPNHKLSPRLDKEISAQGPQGADIRMKNTADSLDNPAQPTSIVDNTLTTKQPFVGYLPSSAITPAEAGVLMNGLTVHLDKPIDTSIKNNDLSSPAPGMTSSPTATSPALTNSLQTSQTNGELQTMQHQQPVHQTIDSAISMPKKGPSGSTSVPGVAVDIQKHMLEDLQQAMDRFLQSQDSDLNIPHANPDLPEERFEQQRPVITEELPLSTFGQLAMDIEEGAGTGFPADYEFEGTLQGSGELVEVLNGRPEAEMKSKSSQQDTPRQSDMKVQRLGDLLLPRTLLERLHNERGDQSSPPQPWKVHRPQQIIVSHSFVLPKSFWTQGKFNENLRDLLANVFFRPPRPAAMFDDVQRPAQKEPEGSGEKDSKEPLGPQWISPKKEVSLYSILLQPGNQISGLKNSLRKRSWLSTVNTGGNKRRGVLSKRSHAKLLQQLSHLLPLSRRRHQREISSFQLEDLDFNCEVVIIPKDLPLKTKIFGPPESVLTENMDHVMMCLVPRQNIVEVNDRGEIVLTRKEHPGYRQEFRYYIGFPNGIRWYDDFLVLFLENNEIFVQYDEVVTTEKIEGLFVTRIRVLTIAPDMKLEILDPHLAQLFEIKPNGQLFLNAGPLLVNDSWYEVNVTVSSNLLNSTKNVSIEIVFQSDDDLDDGDQNEVTEEIGEKRKGTERLTGPTGAASRRKQAQKNKKTKPLVPARGAEDVIFSIAVVILFANIVIIGALFVQWYRKKRPVPVVIRRPTAVTAKRVRNVPEPPQQEVNPAQTKAEETPQKDTVPKNEDVAQAGKPGIAVVVAVSDGAPTSLEVEDQEPTPSDFSEGRGSKEKLVTV